MFRTTTITFNYHHVFFCFVVFRIVVGRKRRYFSTTIDDDDDHGVHAFEMGKKREKMNTVKHWLFFDGSKPFVISFWIFISFGWLDGWMASWFWCLFWPKKKQQTFILIVILFLFCISIEFWLTTTFINQTNIQKKNLTKLSI